MSTETTYSSPRGFASAVSRALARAGFVRASDRAEGFAVRTSNFLTDDGRLLVSIRTESTDSAEADARWAARYVEALTEAGFAAEISETSGRATVTAAYDGPQAVR